MSLPTFIVFLVVLFVGVPSALRLSLRWQRGPKVRVHGIRNATALALVGTWAFGQAVCIAAGGQIPPGDLVKLLLLSDWIVICATLVKGDWPAFEGMGQWLRAIWQSRTPCDRIILALFPVAWLFYAPITDSFTQYWTLYGIGLAQLTLAGCEALTQWLRANGHTSRADDERPPGLRFAAWERGYG